MFCVAAAELFVKLFFFTTYSYSKKVKDLKCQLSVNFHSIICVLFSLPWRLKLKLTSDTSVPASVQNATLNRFKINSGNIM